MPHLLSHRHPLGRPTDPAGQKICPRSPFRDISADTLHYGFAVRREAVLEHVVDRDPIEICKTRLQGVQDDPVQFEELYERL